jgi:hypothetical protein
MSTAQATGVPYVRTRDVVNSTRDEAIVATMDDHRR